MNLKEIAAELAALTVIKDAVKEATDELRTLAKDELINVGADMAKAVVDNQEVAKVSLITRDVDFVIADEQAFKQWVVDNFATEIETKVRESFKKRFIETLAITPDNTIFSTLNGEILDFIQLEHKAPYVSTRFSPGGREAVIQAMHDKRITSLPWLNAYVENVIRKEID
jgi:hypothetical protein